MNKPEITVQTLLEQAVVGTTVAMSLDIDGLPQTEVVAHCMEITSGEKPTKKFKVFSHGVEIADLQTTKEDGKWLPK